MFYVHCRLKRFENQDVLVYSTDVKNYDTYFNTYFLIYGKDGWEWIDSRWCDPIDQVIMY